MLGPPGRKFLLADFRLADCLDLLTVAEGVETEQQADLLRDQGCPLGQGIRSPHRHGQRAGCAARLARRYPARRTAARGASTLS